MQIKMFGRNSLLIYVLIKQVVWKIATSFMEINRAFIWEKYFEIYDYKANENVPIIWLVSK